MFKKMDIKENLNLLVGMILLCLALYVCFVVLM